MYPDRLNQNKGADNMVGRIWIWVCIALVIIGMLVGVMLQVAEIIIIVNTVSRYQDVMGSGGKAPMDGYGGDATCNYVTLSNVPKHWGSIYWTCLFQVSILLWIWVSVAGDAVVFFSGEKNGARSGLAAGRFTGLYPGSHAYQPNQRYTPFFCAANGFLKLFIGVTYLSQSFGGLADGGGHFDRFGQWVGGGPDAQQFCFAAGVTMLLSALPVAFCALYVVLQRAGGIPKS